LPGHAAQHPPATCGHVGTLVGFLVADKSTLVGSTDAGNMALSTDGGHCWTAARLDAEIPHRAGEFVRDPIHPHVLIAASGSIGRVGVASTNGLLRSADTGRSWTQLGPKNGLPRIRFIVSSLAATKSGIYAALSCPDEVSVLALPRHPAFQCGKPIYRSTDGGLTWTPIGPGTLLTPRDALASAYEGSAQALTAAPDGTLLAVLTPLKGTAGLYRSTDHGVTWRPAAPERRLSDTTALLAVDNSGQTMLAGVGIVSANAQLLQSTDAGKHWRQVLAIASMNDPLIVGCARAAGYVFCAGMQHVFRSPDGGATWQEPAENGMSTADITYLSVAPNGALYVSRVGGLFRSADGGDQWTRL
jgi:photosystem II stability/assembly factor-like uncharacterized protein